MQVSAGNLCQFTTSVSDRELIFYYKQTNKNIKTQKKSNRKRHKKNIIMNIYAWEKSSRLATRTVMRNEKSKIQS